MSGLTLIVGSMIVDDAFDKLDLNELYYEKWYEDEENPEQLKICRERFPLKVLGLRGNLIEVAQYLGSGKTLYAMNILAEKSFFGEEVAANLGLIWHNEGRSKEQWISLVNSLDDLDNLNNCTVLIDDIIGTIDNWNTKPALVVTKIAMAARKTGVDVIITAQRDIHIPPNIRKIATEWIIPVIRVRDFTRATPDRDMGYPMEMIGLHFDGTKIFKYMTNPIINLDKLFDCYSTVQIAKSLTGEINQNRIKISASNKKR